MPTAIELALTAAAAAAGGKVRLIDARARSLDATLEKLRECAQDRSGGSLHRNRNGPPGRRP